MDHSQVSSGAEEGCSSCESGWTDYLVSPVQSTDEEEMVDNMNIDDSGEGNRAKNIRNDHKGEDNDSLASDASSGPCYRKHAGKNIKNCRSPNKVEKEDAAVGMKHGSEGSSRCSYKTNFNTSKKERSVDKKAPSQWKSTSSTSASYESNEVRRKR